MTLKSLDYFSSLVRQDDSFPLFETALAIGQDVYPHLDFAAHQVEIDTIGFQLLKRIPADASHIQKLRMLNHLFFQEMGFAGNVNNFFDADNSYVHRVMATRRGIPISLAVIYMELGQQIGLDMKGISFPGHFLMKLTVQSGEIVLDPINGSSLSREELEERIEPYMGQHSEYWRTAAGSLFACRASTRNRGTHAAQSESDLYRFGALAESAGRAAAISDSAARRYHRAPRPRPGLCQSGMTRMPHWKTWKRI